jgi:hypothetical protein
MTLFLQQRHDLRKMPGDTSYDSISQILAEEQGQKKPTNGGFLQQSPVSSPIGKTAGRLSTWRLLALVSSILGAQIVWSIEYGFGSNYLLALGMSKQGSSLHVSLSFRTPFA